MIIEINNKECNIEQESTLKEILAQHLDIHEQKGFAVAVNQEVIPKSLWDAKTFQNGDKIIIITATQGG